MATAPAPSLLFFEPDIEKSIGQEAKSQAVKHPKIEKRLYCAACRRLITHQDERIPVQGGHEHTFTNPHGITFHIGCYREAVGCSAVGESTSEFSWFPGYAWRIALCANCHTHLGWLFKSAEDFFHGLIVNRLTSAGPGGNQGD